MKKRVSALFLALCLVLTLPAAAADDAETFARAKLSGVCEDGGALVATDVYNKVVWRIENGKATILAGVVGTPDLTGEPTGAYRDGAAGQSYFMEPWAIVAYGKGYAVSDALANVVRYIANGKVQTIAGVGKAGSADGKAQEASFDRPTGLAVGTDGSLYVADTGNGAIRRIGTDGKVTTLVKDLAAPTGLCWHDKALYVAETGRCRILRVSPEGGMETAYGLSTAAEDAGEYYGGYVDAPVAAAKFDHPQGVAVGADGTIYVADTGSSAVRAIRDGRVYTLARSARDGTLPVEPRAMLVRDDTLLAADVIGNAFLTLPLTEKSFKDVLSGAWYAEAVRSAVRNGIADGTGDGYFSPDATMNRAMFVTMLSRVHRLTDGAVVINGDATFADVPEGEWFAPSVRWAADFGVTGGDGDGFAPKRSISRQELAAMLYRYAKAQSFDVSASADAFNAFSDAADAAPWAQSAMQWACAKRILGGDDLGRLNPAATATRAQALTMLLRFMEAYSL